MEEAWREWSKQLSSVAGALNGMLEEMGEEKRPGAVEKISATVEQSRREEELAGQLAAVEQELAELKAEREQQRALRRTLPTATAEMLAKHGIGEGPVDVRKLDAALVGLSLEQRIAVKSQLLRSGAIV